MFYQRMVIFYFLVKCSQYMRKNVWQQNEIIIFENFVFLSFLD